MEGRNFNILDAIRYFFVFPLAFFALILGWWPGYATPPMGPRIEIVSSAFPDNLYNIYLGAFTSVYACLTTGAIMAPRYRLATVAIGVFMLVGCGGPFSFAFWQEHFSLPPYVSKGVYCFDLMACLLAFASAHFLDMRMNKRKASLTLVDQTNSHS